MTRTTKNSLALAALLLTTVSLTAQNPPRGGRGGGPNSPMLQISTEPGPAADMVKAALDAFNRRDLEYFRKSLTDDAVWLDDDGHIFATKNQIIQIPLTAELTGETKRKLTPSNMRSSMSGDTAWATFYYELDTDGKIRHGLSTMVFRKIENDWKIAVVQAASNMMQTHLPGDHTDQ